MRKTVVADSIMWRCCQDVATTVLQVGYGYDTTSPYDTRMPALKQVLSSAVLTTSHRNRFCGDPELRLVYNHTYYYTCETHMLVRPGTTICSCALHLIHHSNSDPFCCCCAAAPCLVPHLRCSIEEVNNLARYCTTVGV